MNKSLKVGRLGVKYCWRIGSLHRHAGHATTVRGMARYTFDDLTQARLDAAKRNAIEVPKESPWRDSKWSPDFPKRLNEHGYESHCNDRLYIAKNRNRHHQQEYAQQRHERRLEAQMRIKSHFERVPEVPVSRKAHVMQDPVEHKARQEQIIEMNRRRWQSRPEARREINTSGITYRPDLQKQVVPSAKQLSQDLDRQRGLMRCRERSESESKAVADEEDWQAMKAQEEDWRTRSQSLDSGLQRRLKKLMEISESETNPEAEESERSPRAESERSPWTESERRPRAESERSPWAESERSPWTESERRPRAESERSPWAESERRPRAESEEQYWQLNTRKPESEEDWRTNGQDFGLQRRLKKLMEVSESETKPESEEGWQVKSQKAESEHEDWRLHKTRAEAEDQRWFLNSRKPESEQQGWRSPRAESEWSPRAESERSPRAESEWSPRAESEWSPRAESERSPRAESERSPRAESEWSPRAESERSPRAESEWSPRAESERSPRMRGQSLDSGLQRRLRKLMEISESEKIPEAEVEDWRVNSPKAESERSPRAESERSPRAESERSPRAESEEEDWRARNLSLVYDPNRPSKEWQKKREAEQESQYWHSWHTCPSTREAETSVELKPHMRRKKVVTTTSNPRDGQRRGYHQLAPATNRFKAKTIILLRKGRPNGLERQYHKFARQQTGYYPDPSEDQSEPLANGQQMPKPLRVIPKKEEKAKPKRKSDRKRVLPPRFKMTIKSRPGVARMPVSSHSRRLNIPPEVAGPSFHMANLLG